MFGPDDFEMQIQEEIPGVRTEPSIPPAQDEQYGDFIVKYGQNIWRDYENRPDSEFLPVVGQAATPGKSPVRKTSFHIRPCSVLRWSFSFLLHKDLAADEGVTGGCAAFQLIS